MLACSQKLRDLLLEDPEACRCDMSAMLFAEFEALRDLNERKELEKANRELARRAQEDELLFSEIHHRVKNNLQIVSSVLHMQLPKVNDPAAAELLRSSETRVRAIAAVHERLYRDDGINSIDFDSYLRGICEDVARAYGEPDGVMVETQPVAIGRDQAISVALIVNELVTNAFRHGSRPCRVQLLDEGSEVFRLTVSDCGTGPSGDENSDGFGTRLIDSLCRQLDATLDKSADGTGYRCRLLIPHPAGIPAAAQD
jgi:two-component sensor histidine kinase